MANIVCVIPARLGSYRFKDKPLAKICGRPMIEHVYKRAKLSPILSEVYVATPNKELKELVESFGGKAIMTSDNARRASDRVAEAVRDIDADIVVDLQGDEPLVTPEMIEAAVQPILDDPAVDYVNLVTKIDREAAQDRNEIKVVFDKDNFAMFFSREPIPSFWLGDKVFPYYKAVCVMPFRRKALELYTSLPSTPLEIIESLDQLRFLEHGYKVKVVEIEGESYSVDVPEDVKNVERVMKTADPLSGKY